MTSFQDRSAAWMDVAFANDPTDGPERRDRAAEEDCEAYQADGGTLEDWIAIGRYTFGRPAGALPKEFGQKVFTLACWAAYLGIDMMAEAERELARCSTPEFIEKLARKRATRHGRGPLPGFSGPETSDPGVAPASFPTPDGVTKERGEVAELVAAVTDLLNNSIEHPIGDEYAIHPDDWDKRPGDSLGKQIYRSRWMLRDRVRKALRSMSSPSSQESGVGETEGWRPIETAPRDGTRVLLRFEPPFSDSLEDGIVTGLSTGAGWWLSSILAATISHKEPVGWIPLPSAPRPSQREG